MSTFAENFKSGHIRIDTINDYVDVWHRDNDSKTPLWKYLGLERDQYHAWVAYGDDVLAAMLRRDTIGKRVIS